MAGLENLFATEPTLPSVQTTKIPDDPQQWAEVITTRLREQYPEVTRLPLTVEYRKKDPQSGTAIGAIHVTNADNAKKMFVPFILKKFELFPLDIWMEAQTQNVHPLTNDTFKEQFFERSMADGLDQRPFDAAGQYFNDPSLWTTNYPPLQGRYSYASAGFPILDLISDSIEKKHQELFRKALEKSAYVLPKFKAMKKAAEALAVIEKIAKKTDVKNSTNDFASSATKLIPIGVASIKREGADKYSILSMADQLFDIAASEYMSREDCARFLSKITPKPWDLLHDVDQEGEKMVVMKKPPEKGVFLYDDMRDKPEVANEFATYDVRNKTGMGMLGIVFPYVVNFAGKKQSQKLFISADNSTMQSEIVGIKRPNSDHVQKLFKHPKGARVGQTGTFIFIDDGKAIATVPVTIKAIEERGPITAIMLNGEKIKIKRSFSDEPNMACSSSGEKKEKNFLDAHGMVEVRPKEYVIPSRMCWYPMEGFRDVSSSVQDWMNKEASTHIGMDPLVLRWTGIVYDISGAGMSKVSLDERRTKLLLANRGATLDKVAQIIKKARESGRVKVHGVEPLRSKEEIVKHAQGIYEKLESICDGIRKDLVKEAAEIDDSMTVDALLSLGFINPDNLAKFVSFRPVFEKVLDYLAELTLACRLGLKDMNESALVTAMGRLEDVVEGLKRVENGLKKPGIKTAAAAAKPAANGADKGQPSEIPASKPHAGNPKADDPFADGMADGEMATHMYIDKWRKDSRAMLQYMNGKRLSEANKASAAMSIGMQPPKGMKPAKPAGAPAKPAAGGAKK